MSQLSPSHSPTRTAHSTPCASTPTVHIHDHEAALGVAPGEKDAAVAPLPPGCHFGPTLHQITSTGQIISSPSGGSGKSTILESTPTPIIWVDFPLDSPDNPFFFSRRRKWSIMAVALFFAFITAFQTSAYSIGFPSMQRDLGMTSLQAAAGVSLYGWGFAIGPLALAPVTEEFGRYWAYVFSVLAYALWHITGGAGQNVATVLLGRFFLGLSGCIGATVVAGTISDLYPPAVRGLPMSIFTFFVTVGPGVAPVIMCWVEAAPNLEWRWIYWIQMIALAVYWPFVFFVLSETRSTILLRRRAKKLRKERGMQDGGRYTARSEVDKLAFWAAMRTSLSRPLMFLALEPVVTFFALWASLAWGVFFIQIAGLPAVFRIVHGFDTTQSGLIYISLIVGTILGFCLNLIQDKVYARRVAKDGVEARLYAAMGAGLGLAVGCMIFGLTALPGVPWIAPCIGLVIILAAAYTIYQACFVYLAECYGAQASSAVAAMSFLRILVGSAFPMFTNQMFANLTPRWSLFLMGCIAIMLAPIPFVAYFKGPWIRERSPYSKRLMAEERKRIEVESGAAIIVPARPGAADVEK